MFTSVLEGFLIFLGGPWVEEEVEEGPGSTW